MERFFALKSPAGSVADPAKRARGYQMGTRLPSRNCMAIRHGHSFICSTGEAGSVGSTSDNTPASMYSTVGSAARRMYHSLSDAANMQTSVLPVGAYSQQSHQQFSISSEATARSAVAAQLLNSTLMRYRDECSRACSVLCAVFVA